MAKSKLETWQEELERLNYERAQVVYRLRDEAGHPEDNWGATRLDAYAGHEDLEALNQQIQEHLAQHPDTLEQARVADVRRDYQELKALKARHDDPEDAYEMLPHQLAKLDEYNALREA